MSGGGPPYEKGEGSALDTFGFEALAVAASAIGFTAASVSPTGGAGRATMVSVQVEGAPVRYRMDGTSPTATVGTLIQDGGEIQVFGSQDIDSIKFIRSTGVSATLNCHYAR